MYIITVYSCFQVFRPNKSQFILIFFNIYLIFYNLYGYMPHFFDASIMTFFFFTSYDRVRVLCYNKYCVYNILRSDTI